MSTFFLVSEEANAYDGLGNSTYMQQGDAGGNSLLTHTGMSLLSFEKRIGRKMIRWLCDKCGGALKCSQEFAGRRAKCGSCGTVQYVPHNDEIFDVAIALPHLMHVPESQSEPNMEPEPEPEPQPKEDSVHLWEADSEPTDDASQPEPPAPAGCVWCSSDPSRKINISGWDFPFCGNDGCVDEATELINQHIFKLMWLEDSDVESLPDTPQMKCILETIQRSKQAENPESD